MRRLAVILSVIAILVGLPKLADKFRQDRASRSPSAISPGEPEMKALPKIAESNTPSLSGEPAAHVPLPVTVTPLPVSLTTPAQPAEAAAENNISKEVFETRGQLVTAIQKELVRLGFYDGPVSSKWTKQVRIAARKFAKKSGLNVRYVKPTEELLQSMRASGRERTEAKKDPAPGRKAENTQVTAVERASSVEIAAPVKKLEAVHTGEYLPPWMRVETASLPIPPDPARPNADQTSGPLAVASTVPNNHTFDTSPAVRPSSNPGNPSAKKQKAAKARAASLNVKAAYRPVRTAPAFRNANFSWPGQ